MMGGTDHDCGEGHYPAQLLGREAVQDVVYEARARAQSISWLVVLGGLGSILTGLAQHDTALLCSGITGTVVAFIPRARPEWVYRFAQTVLIARGWMAVPASERPLRTPDEIAAQHGWTPLPNDGTTHRYLYEGGPDVIRYPELPERERPN